MLGVGAFCYGLVSGTGVGSLLTKRIAGSLDKQFYAWALLGYTRIPLALLFKMERYAL
jgi:hypothetical protein